MCWVCDNYSKSGVMYRFGPNLDALRGEFDTFGDSFAYVKLDSTTFSDYKNSPVASADLSLVSAILTSDAQAGDIGTTATLDVNGAHLISTIDTIGDQDFFKVELVAGRTYDIGQYLTTNGPNKIGLADAFLEIYDNAGNLLTQADGGGPNTPSGLDALLTFVPKESGTYFINARAYDQDSINGTTGDFVGDYEIFVKDVTDAPRYKPYYDVDSPLHSLDWGSQVDRTSRNPDGQEGPRSTGNAFTGVGNSFGIEGKNVITVYFAKAGDVFVSQDPTNPGLTENIVAKGLQAWEKEAFLKALGLFEQVADLVFIEVSNRAEADFKVITYNGTPGPGASVLGRMNPPNEGNEGQAEFNSGDTRWTEAGLKQGGFYFTTLIHEFGHGLGMAHPHDTGGRSSVMRGAGGGTAGIGGAYGDFGLSQQVFTMMSYNKGWSLSPYGTPKSGWSNAEHFGWAGTLGALDIAVIQDKYGVNEDWATGDDVYEIKDFNAPGNFYSTIWDAGGFDQIVYKGTRDTVIDLRPATLKYEEGGGGFMSYAFGVHGGFTIANSVTIEAATSGAGNDKLIGNDAANILESGAGNDSLLGNGGNDRLVGGAGTDSLSGGSGRDTFVFKAGDSAVGLGRDQIVDFEDGSDRIDLSGTGAKGFVGSALFSGRAGEVRYASFSNTTIVEVDSDGDRVADLQIELSGQFILDNLDFVDLVAFATEGDDVLTGTDGSDTIRGLGGNDVLRGLAGNDTLDGGAGNDVLIGGLGRDLLTGGAGADRFRLENAAESSLGGRDRILDFQKGLDKIDLSSLDGDFAFLGKKAFTGAAGQLRYTKLDGVTLVEGDLDGDKVADFQIEVAGRYDLIVTDFVL